ncbi:MAG: VOC family protein [bacterium]|nr:VOC family protein [bacterium]
MFSKVNTIAVYVSDIAAAKDFYTGILGFEVKVELGPELCFLVSKSGEIHVYLEGGYKPNAVDEDTARLSFFLKTRKPVSEAFAELKTAGVELLDEAPSEVGDNVYAFRFKDPDGNILEVSGSE